MAILPNRALLFVLALPLALSVAALPEPELLRPILVLDGVILVLALIDLALVLRPVVEVRRRVKRTLSLARPVQVALDVRNLSRRRLRVQVQDALFEHAATEGAPVVLEVGPGAVREGSYKLMAMQRGVHVIGDHHVRYPSPAGLWLRQLRLPGEDRLNVYPDVQAVRHYELLARQDRDHYASRLVRMRGGDTEFERLRDYLPDDEFRKIDWKATARRRKLTVREYQLEKNQNVVFVLDCGRTMGAVWDELTALDYALNAVLMLSHVAIRRGDQVGLVAFDEKVTRVVKPRGGVSASNQIIQSVFDLFPRMVESDYEAAFRTLRRHVQKRTLVVFICHAIDDTTARNFQRLTRELLPRHLPLCVLLKDREVEARASQVARNEEEACVQAAAAEVLAWRHRVVNEMQRAGVLVLDVLHHQLTGALVSRYLEVKARGLI